MTISVRNHGLGKRGLAVFRALGGSKLDPARRELAVEAGRMLDRLERLDSTIAGDEKFLTLFHFRMRHELDDSGEATVDLVIDKALSEARALQLAYANVVKVLAAPAKAEAAAPATTKDPVDDIAARIAARAAARAAASS